MRHDMYKVIVERPRRGGGFRSERPAPLDLDESPTHESLKHRHRNRKWLNENLAPLRRFLASQVGRPWDKVYSEICAGIDRRNTVQKHIHQHIEGYVAIHVHLVDGVLYVDRFWNGRIPLADRWAPEFYVDPVHRLLRVNAGKLDARRKSRADRHAELHNARAVHSDVRRIVDAAIQLHRIAGFWYRVELAPVAGNDNVIDALRHLPVSQCPRWDDAKNARSNYSLFDAPDAYARSKRQLNARELRHYHLSNLT